MTATRCLWVVGGVFAALVQYGATEELAPDDSLKIADVPYEKQVKCAAAYTGLGLMMGQNTDTGWQLSKMGVNWLESARRLDPEFEGEIDSHLYRSLLDDYMSTESEDWHSEDLISEADKAYKIELDAFVRGVSEARVASGDAGVQTFITPYFQRCGVSIP